MPEPGPEPVDEPPEPPDIQGRLAKILENLRSRLLVLRDQESTRLLGIGVLLGALAGLAAAGLDTVIQGVAELLLRNEEPSLGGLVWWRALLAPVAGGLIAGPLIYWGTREGRPQGIPEVIEATSSKDGQVSLRNAAATALAAAAVVGGGQSGGREGPIVQLSAALASRLCRSFQVSPNRARVLVAAGAAGGIAASFNTPLGGAFFALEIVLGNFAMHLFGPVVAASVAGTVVGQALLGDRIALHLPAFSLGHVVELPLYLVLGLLCGAVAVAFKNGILESHRVLEPLKLPIWLMPAAAGLACGLLSAVGFHQVMGNGYAFMDGLLGGQLHPTAATLLMVLIAKVIATVLTSAGGGGSGLFSPSMFVGAVTGSLFGALVHGAWPAWTAPASAWGIIGVGAVTASVTHAPITTALMLFEMTRHYEIILPLLLAMAGASLVTAALDSEGIYRAKLRRRGVKLDQGREELVMHDLRVRDLMREEGFETISPLAPFAELSARFLNIRGTEIYVVDPRGRYHGLVNLADIKRQLVAPTAELVVADVEARAVTALGPEQTLADCLPLFFRADLDELPVVDNDGTLVGVLRERDVVGAYNREVLRKEALLARITHGPPEDRHTDFVELPPGYALDAVEVSASMAGRSLRQLALPARHGLTVIAVSIYEPTTGRHDRVPAQADLILKAGDRLVVLGPEARVEAMRAAAGQGG